MNKKAQGISINVIVIAALALAVLVVMFATFTGRIGIFSRGVASTDSALDCDAQCKVTGYVSGKVSINAKNNADPKIKGTCGDGENRIFGSVSDLTEGNVCCCKSS